LIACRAKSGSWAQICFDGLTRSKSAKNLEKSLIFGKISTKPKENCGKQMFFH